jgi:hypothetical protein
MKIVGSPPPKDEPSLVDRALAPVKRILPNMAQRFNEADTRMGQGIGQLGRGEVLGGAWKTLTGGLAHLSAPFGATVDSLLGEPLEKATGLPKEYTEFVAGLLMPGVAGGNLSAPFDAATDSLLLGPLAKTTGLPKEFTGLAAGMFMPGAAGGNPLGLLMPRAEGGNLLEQVAKKTSTSLAGRVLSPTTVDEAAGRTEDAIRRGLGRESRDTATTQAALKPEVKAVEKFVPEFQAYNDLPPEQRATVPRPKMLDWLSYMEGRTKNAQLPTPELQSAADKIRDSNAYRESKYKSMPGTEKAGAIEDYFVHEWENPDQARQFAGNWIAKQGSGRNLKERSIPTIEEGLAAGLKLKTPNPVEAHMRYTANMDRYLANNEIVDTMTKAGDAKYFMSRGAAPEGWVPLKGRLATRDMPDGTMTLYAPPNAATVYNNFVSRGFAEIGPNAGQAFDMAQKVTNGAVALKLGLSGYHVITMAKEAIINDVARAVGQAGRGEILNAAKTAGLAVTAPVKTMLRGRQFLKEYLKPPDPTAAKTGSVLEQIADLGTDANMRAIGRDPSMFASGKGSYWTAYRNGTLGREMKTSFKNSLSLSGATKEVIGNGARLLDTISQPIFDRYIPLVKSGAFYDNMADWLKANPGASVVEQRAASRAIWDSIDNRFGELVQDNLFWNKIGKQTAQVLTVSPGWNIGTIRELGGGVMDLATGKGLTERGKYVVAMPIVTGVVSSILQFLKTGQAPDEKSMMGLFATGGTNPDGTPERAMSPGYEKDVYGYAHDPLGEVANKLNPAVSTGVDLLRNKDYRGQVIMNPNGTVGERLGQAGEFLFEQSLPISVGTLAHRKKGTGISIGEGLLGVRPAPEYLQEPEAYEGAAEKRGQRAWKAKLRADQRQRNQMED